MPQSAMNMALFAEAQRLAHIGSWNWDIVRNTAVWSEEHYRIFGVPLEVPINYEKFLECVHPEDRAAVNDLCEKAFQNGQPFAYSCRVVHADGTERIVESHGQVIFEAGKPVRMFGTAHDVTERKQAEEARKQLENEVLDAAAREQRRIGLELHDNVGQELTALRLLAEALAQSLKDRPSETALLAKIVRGLKRTLGQVRTISCGLIPVEVDSRGLHAALADLAARTNELGEVACLFDGYASVEVDDNQTATHLFHIAQEAVTNALRHGDPAHVTIRLAEVDHSLALSIHDDGHGFPAPATARRGIGLKIMQYRANLCHGELTVGPGASGGTVVLCKLSRDK